MSKATDKQVGGQHYKECKIQPIEYIVANSLGFCEGNAIKYITRHQSKNKAEDIKKAIHYLELILQFQYPESCPPPQASPPSSANVAPASTAPGAF